MNKTIFVIFIFFSSLSWGLTFSNGEKVEIDVVINFEEGPLEKLIVPTSWPFKGKSSFLEEHKKFSIGDNGISEDTKDKCVELFINWKKNSSSHREDRGGGCFQKLAWWYYNSGDINPIKEVIYSWATKGKPEFDIYQDDFNPDHYDAIALLTIYSSFYAVKYDEFDFNSEERSIVDEFILNEMLTIPINTVGDPKNQFFCDPYKHDLIGRKNSPRPDINTCGSNRWKTTIAQLLVALRLGDQNLFNEGVYNTRFKLALFDDEGIYVTWATRGALAWDYSHDVTTMLSLLTEIYKSIGYDFLEYQLENGLYVKDLFSKQFEIVDDVSILDKYAKRQYAVKGTNYNKWKKLNNNEKLGIWPKTSVVYSAKSYIQKYDKNLQKLIDCNTSLFSPSTNAITSFNLIDIWELHYLNNPEGFCSSNKDLKNNLDAKKMIDNKITISWFTALKFDNYKKLLEAKDIITYKPNGSSDLIEINSNQIERDNLSLDSKNQGRENLKIYLSKERIKIVGKIQVFENEYIDIDLEEDLSEGEVKIIFGDDDEFIIGWDN
mgnify:FL=1